MFVQINQKKPKKFNKLMKPFQIVKFTYVVHFSSLKCVLNVYYN